MNFKTVLRYALLLASLMVVGPLCSRALADVRDADGGHATTMLVNDSLGGGLLGGALVFAGAVLVGWLGAHFYSISTGFACAGLVVAWGAWSTGTLDQIARRAGGAGDFRSLALESAIALLLAGLVTAVLWLAARKRQPQGAKSGASPGLLAMLVTTGEVKGRSPKPAALICASALAASIVGAGAAYLIAMSTLKGQAVFASFCAALAGGLAAQFVASSMGGTASPLLVVLALLLPAVAGPLVHGSDAATLAAVYANTSMPLARIMPLDWAAGALLGAPIGLGWAGAMIDARMV